MRLGRWSVGRGREGAADERSADPPGCRSPGLAAALRRLPGERRGRLVDLGGATGPNLDLYGRIAGAVTVVDLPSACHLGGSSGPVDPDRPAAVVAEVLGRDPTPVDLVLAWDLLDYLGDRAVERLCAALAERCRPGAVLLAFVTHTDVVPSAPARWAVHLPDRLVREVGGDQAVRPGPGWPPARVEKLLVGFRVEESFVLGRGAREYVAVRG